MPKKRNDRNKKVPQRKNCGIFRFRVRFAGIGADRRTGRRCRLLDVGHVLRRLFGIPFGKVLFQFPVENDGCRQHVACGEKGCDCCCGEEGNGCLPENERSGSQRQSRDVPDDESGVEAPVFSLVAAYEGKGHLDGPEDSDLAMSRNDVVEGGHGRKDEDAEEGQDKQGDEESYLQGRAMKQLGCQAGVIRAQHNLEKEVRNAQGHGNGHEDGKEYRDGPFRQDGEAVSPEAIPLETVENVLDLYGIPCGGVIEYTHDAYGEGEGQQACQDALEKGLGDRSRDVEIDYGNFICKVEDEFDQERHEKNGDDCQDIDSRTF